MTSSSRCTARLRCTGRLAGLPRASAVKVPSPENNTVSPRAPHVSVSASNGREYVNRTAPLSVSTLRRLWVCTASRSGWTGLNRTSGVPAHLQHGAQSAS